MSEPASARIGLSLRRMHTFHEATTGVLR